MHFSLKKSKYFGEKIRKLKEAVHPFKQLLFFKHPVFFGRHLLSILENLINQKDLKAFLGIWSFCITELKSEKRSGMM